MRRNLWIGLSLIVCASFVGCGRTQTTATSWAFDFIKWHNHTYKVTAEQISTVGQQVGAVTHYSNHETASQSGTFSNKYPVGTKLYSIPQTDTARDIAVQTKDGKYLEADAQKN